MLLLRTSSIFFIRAVKEILLDVHADEDVIKRGIGAVHDDTDAMLSSMELSRMPKARNDQLDFLEILYTSLITQ